LKKKLVRKQICLYQNDTRGYGSPSNSNWKGFFYEKMVVGLLEIGSSPVLYLWPGFFLSFLIFIPIF